MVLNYTCLFWATMFGDRCYNETMAPRKPCRDFCVDLALTCANRDDWINLCHNIGCPQPRGRCTRGPLNVTGHDCYIFKYTSARNSARGGLGGLQAWACWSTCLAAALALAAPWSPWNDRAMIQ